MTPAARGAFIGYGHVASEGHSPAWCAREDVVITAAVEVAPARRERFLQTWPQASCYWSLEELLAGESLDFVDICTPPGSHAGLIGKALAAGLHVLCEKPLTTRADDALRLAAQARRTGRVLHTVHNWLAAPICRQISQLIAAGEIGEVRSVNWTVLRTQPSVAVSSDGEANWRLDPETAGGGILLDHGWHAFYCVGRWLGGEPRRISARLENRGHQGLAVEDTATVELDSGRATGRIHLTWAGQERSNQIEIEGGLGRIRIQGESVFLETAAGSRHWSCPPSLSAGSHHADWFSAVADDFLAAVAGGGAGNLAEAVLCARLMQLAQQSNASGGAWLDLGADERVS